MNTILLQAQGGNAGMMNIIMLIAMFAVFYFFMIRPQQKKRKELEAYRASITKGDKIITIGGIHGKVTDVKETTVTITVESGAKLKIEKSAISMDATTLLGGENDVQA